MPNDGSALRAAVGTDGDATAALHAASWRSACRGMMSDADLDGPVGRERQMFWHVRLRSPRAGLWTLLADHDHHGGTLIDNIHVAPMRGRASAAG